MRRLSVRGRWAVPVGAVAVVGLVASVTVVARANAAPSLPARSASQLIAEVVQATAKPLGPLTASVQQSSNLGLPALPSTGPSQGSGPFGSTSGSQTTNIWYLNRQHVRIAEISPMQETDLRLNGRTLWLWNSKTQTATRVVLPASSPGTPQVSPGTSATAVSPLAAARQVLAAIGPSTVVSVQRNVTVAGRPAYQLSLVPKSTGSLVGQVLIAIDAARHIPLRVEVIARGSSSPAYEIGFTSLTFGPPAASNFTFTPPAGAKVKTETVPSKTPAGASQALRNLLGGQFGMPFASTGPFGWTGTPPAQSSVAVGCTGVSPGRASVASSLNLQFPKNFTKAERAKISSALRRLKAGKCSVSSSGGAVSVLPDNGSFFAGLPAASVKTAADAPPVIGKAWLSVIATPPNPAVAAAVQQLLSPRRSNSPPPLGSYTSGTATFSLGQATQDEITSAPASVPVGPDLAVLRALLQAAKPVHGSWGSGRLLRTSLLSVLITSNGRILAGAVTPAVLYADAALPVK